MLRDQNLPGAPGRHAPPPPANRSWAYFLDFDGTLVDIAESPDAVAVTPRLADTLRRLAAATGGAVAIVSGRSLDQIDRFLGAVGLPAAGQHGNERRDAAGTLHRHASGDAMLARMAERILGFCRDHPGTTCEDKGFTVALHYRNAPDAEGAARALMDSLRREAAGRYLVQEGKKVLELKPVGTTKATALDAFLVEPPFAGRLPVFAGDDVTDEDGFRHVNEAGGISIRIGRGAVAEATAARFSLPDPNALVAWLDQAARPQGAD